MLEHDLVHIRRSKFIHEDAVFERIAVRNFADRPLAIEIALRFAADFADLFEVRGAKRSRRGRMLEPVVDAERRAPRLMSASTTRSARTRLRFEPVPSSLGPDRATFERLLPPGGEMVLHLEDRGFTASALPAAPALPLPGRPP